MGRIAFVADVHLGNHKRHGGAYTSGLNRRCLQACDVFEKAVAEAARLGCTAFVVLGDLFDTAHPEAQLIARTQLALQRGVGNRDMRVLLLVGNHDQQSDAPGDHALGPLAEWATVVERPTVVEVAGAALVMVPYRGTPAKEWLGSEVQALLFDEVPFGQLRRVLCVHMGVADDQTAPFLRGARDSIHVDLLTEVAKTHGCTHVLAGNWHNRIRWDGEDQPTVLQVGTLVPTGWDNPGHDGYGTLAVLDTDTGALTHKVLMGPRFETCSMEELDEVLSTPRDYPLYLSVRVDQDTGPTALAAIEAAVARGALAAGEAVPDKAVARAAARTAAHSARSQTTLDEALAAYVAAMAVDAGVDRADVLARAKNYLVKGA